jgi:hypothetical protein
MNEPQKILLKILLLVFLDLMLVRSDFNSRAIKICAAHRRRLLLQLTKTRQKELSSKYFSDAFTFLDSVKK